MKKRIFAVSFLIAMLIILLSGCGSRERGQADYAAYMEETALVEQYALEAENEDPPYAPDPELIRWQQVKALETEDYHIVEVKEEDEYYGTGDYPQIVLKEGKEIFCGTEYINSLLKGKLYHRDYNILYADQHYISIWSGDAKTGKTETVYAFNLQCPEYARDDNDYRKAPQPSNGIILSLDAVLEEIQNGNYYTDAAGDVLYQEDPDAFIASVRRQFEEIKKGGYEEAYWSGTYLSKMAYRMYIREGRVGFYIHPIDVWESVEGKEGFYGQGPNEPIDTDRDFRIEVAYDWQKGTPVYHMPYEIYGELTQSETYGTFYYPQIKGLDENITSALNAAMKQDLDDNLACMDLDEWNEIMSHYQDAGDHYFKELPSVEIPMVTYQTEKYLCIWQDTVYNYHNMLPFLEDWKWYHVYDLEAGKSLQLEDIIRVDEEFVTWLKEEKKIEATHEFKEGMKSIYEPDEWMKEELDDYPADLLLDILEDAEFWLKDGSLFIKIPRYNMEAFHGMVYLGGGNGYPNHLIYYEVRLDLADIKDFLKAEPWSEEIKEEELQLKIVQPNKTQSQKAQPEKRASKEDEADSQEDGEETKEPEQTGYNTTRYIIELEYDNAGNLTEESWNYEDGSVSHRHEYEYDSAGNRIREINYNFNDDIYGLWYQYEYDEAGKLIKSVGYHTDGTVDSFSEYEYDGTGSLAKETVYDADGGVNYWDEYQYDSAGSQTKQIRFNSAGYMTEWDMYQYEYDSQGNKVRALLYIVRDGRLMYQYGYEYDGAGNQTKMLRYYRDGSSDTEWEYRYDSAGNPVEATGYYKGSIRQKSEYEYRIKVGLLHISMDSPVARSGMKPGEQK